MSTTSADPCDQVVEGTDDGDVMNGGKGDDTFDGGDGDDILNGGAGSDTLSGGEGDDQLNGGSGDDVLTGGDGDDVLNGGGGSDVYKFYFALSAGGTQTITYDPVPLDYDAETNSRGTTIPPDGEVSQNEFAQFQQDYEAWLDANAPDGYEYDAPQSDPLTSGSDPDLVDGSVSSVELTNGQDRYWEPTIEVSNGNPEITAADGDDTITQFQNSGPNVDTIELCGITQEQAAALFTYQTGDFDNDGYADDARISWEGATDDADGSITIVGTTWADLDAFLNDPYVVFS